MDQAAPPLHTDHLSSDSPAGLPSASQATQQATSEATSEESRIAVPVLVASFLLAGIGTVMLGPLLPTLSAAWHLTDTQAGLLLAAKFVGATLGGLSTPRRQRRGIAVGHLFTAAGFFALAHARGMSTALPSLFVSGVGLGLIIANTNVLAGRRWRTHTGSVLSLLNLFWSLGAVSCGLLVAALLPRFGWQRPVLWFAVCFVLLALATWPWVTSVFTADATVTEASGAAGLSAKRALPFGLTLFLYGGLETCLTAWLTTYTLRLGGHPLAGGQSAFVLLWSALTGGRVLASAAMRLWSERAVLRGSLVLTLGCIGLLIAIPRPGWLTGICVALGLVLSAVFPSTFALLMERRPSARLAGGLLAVSGLGAALFPWLMGVLSDATGSLRTGMAIPLLLPPLLLGMTRWMRSPAAVPKQS